MAEVLESGLGENGPNRLATFTASFRLVEEVGSDQPVVGDQQIVGYFYIEKRNGSPNTTTIDQIKNALGWDGSDLRWLANQNFAGTRVQLTLGWEEWDNRNRLKIKWMDHENFSPMPPVEKADDATLRAMNARLGSKLRANMGRAPASGSKPPTAAAPVSVAGVCGTQDKAWDKFAELGKNHNITKEPLEKMWFEAIAKVAPDTDTADITPEQWEAISDQAIPF